MSQTTYPVPGVSSPVRFPVITVPAARPADGAPAELGCDVCGGCDGVAFVPRLVVAPVPGTGSYLLSCLHRGTEQPA